MNIINPAKKIKRCSYPNSLKDNKKGDISVALCTCAPPSVLFSNQFKEDLARIYELNGFIDVSASPIASNNPIIYRHLHPTMILNQ